MTRPHALMESIPASANLNEFLHSIDTDLTKPRKKLLRDALVALPGLWPPMVHQDGGAW